MKLIEAINGLVGFERLCGARQMGMYTISGDSERMTFKLTTSDRLELARVGRFFRVALYSAETGMELRSGSTQSPELVATLIRQYSGIDTA